MTDLKKITSLVLLFTAFVSAHIANADTWGDRAAAANAAEGQENVAYERSAYAARIVDYHRQLARLAGAHGGLAGDEGCNVNAVRCTAYDCMLDLNDQTIPLVSVDGNYVIDYCRVNLNDGQACLLETDVSTENFGGSYANCYDRSNVSHFYRFSKAGGQFGAPTSKKSKKHR